MLVNEHTATLLYLQLKGRDFEHYQAIRSQYETLYNQRNLKTPFTKHWALVLSKIKKTYGYRVPARRESLHQKTIRMQTPIATAQEIKEAKFYLDRFLERRNQRKPIANYPPLETPMHTPDES